MERFKSQTVALSEIDGDDRQYRITTQVGHEDLIASIESVGLVQSPVLLQAGAHYIVVGGRRRLAACAQLGLKTVVARTLPGDIPVRLPALLAVADNSLQRPLNLIEAARALNLVASVVTEREAFNRLCTDLKLPHQPHLIEKIISLVELPPKIQTYVANGHIPLTMAVSLNRLEDREWSIMLADLFHDLGLSLNKQREIATLATEIARRAQLHPQAVLTAPACQAILRHPDLDVNQKTRRLRAYLRRQRFPHVHQAEQAFENHRHQLPLGPNIQLTPPANFEGAHFSLKLNFQSRAELRNHIKQLKALLDSTHLNAILDKFSDP
jgi:ParB family chromosome partitioning protein